MVEYVGVDIGGTNIRVGAIDEEENLVFCYQEKTFEGIETSEELYEKIVKLIQKVPNYENCKAIGIGVPGSIDNEKKEVTIAENVKLLNNFPIVHKIGYYFKKPVYIENDARVAGLAETIKGAGKNKDIVCYITISTGLGGGVIFKNKIYQGSNNLGGYFSRMIIDGKNTANTLVSGTGLLNIANKKLDTKITDVTGLFELEKTNQTAKKIVSEFKQNLAVLLINIASIINPDVIILGGGLLKSKEKFMPEVIELFKKQVHPLAQNTVIEYASLNESGTIGAALFAKQNYQEKNG